MNRNVLGYHDEPNTNNSKWINPKAETVSPQKFISSITREDEERM